MRLPTEWFPIMSGVHEAYWRVDEDCDVELDGIKYQWAFIDQESLEHMVSLVRRAKAEENDNA